MKGRTLALAVAALVGALAYSAIFSLRLSAVPSVNYAYGDDAVITLSHARNLVDYGFIGVSPSGERVEGFSAPLQFWMAAAMYRIQPFDYRTFFDWQTLIGTALLGLSIAVVLLSGAPSTTTWAWFALAVAAIVASAEILARSRAFLLWHASGMENVYKNIALVAMLGLLDHMLRTSRIHYAAIALVFVASITRIDSIVPVGALLLAFAVMWAVRYRTAQGARFAALSLLPWAAYMGWRVWYFGEWMPNTGVAQHISIGDRIAVALHTPMAAVGDYYAWLIQVGGSLHAVQFLWLPLLLVWVRRSRTALARCALLAAGGLACVAQYALFGPARMDSARTVSEFAVYATLLVPWTLLAKTDWRLRDALIGAGMIAVSLGVVETRPPDRAEVGYSSQYFEPTAVRAAAIAAEHDLPRPTLANADLGAVSWTKQFNMLDFGALGSATVPRVNSPVRYIAEFAKPDIIEIHDAWSCLYNDLFINRDFAAEYVVVSAARTPWLEANCAPAPQAMTGYWVRRAIMKGSASPERIFLDAFRNRLDPDLVRHELERCRTAPGSRPCAYVGRTVFRFVPELKARGTFDVIASLLRGDQRLAVDYAYFTSSIDPRWVRAVLPWADPVPITLQPSTASMSVRPGSESLVRSEILLEVARDARWRLELPAGAWFDVQPSTGEGPATLTITPKGVPEGREQELGVPIFANDGLSPSVELRVALKSVAASPNLPPSGAVDVPADPVKAAGELIVFQGWAVDDHGLRSVWVGCQARDGTMTHVTTAARTGERPDIAKLFPNSPDRRNSGWAIRLRPGEACSWSPTTLLTFVAEDVEGLRTTIGTRTLVR